MAVIIKPKRSEDSGSIPTTSDLEVGEIAVNTTDRTIYTKNTSGNVIKIANYAEADPTLVFPTGDLGSLSSASDAFGQTLETSFDSLDTPNGSLSTQDLGALS
jgi:hypothetical protein